MAEGAPYIECDSAGLMLHADSSDLEVLNALLVKDNSGNYGLRVANRAVSAGNISAGVACGGRILTIGEILKLVVVESASGKPALSLIEEA